MEKKETADLFAFLYFIRYMDEPGDPPKGKILIETKACIKCHTVKEGAKRISASGECIPTPSCGLR